MHCCFLVLPFQEQQAPFQNTTFWNTEPICDSPTLIEQLSLFTSTKPMKSQEALFTIPYHKLQSALLLIYTSHWLFTWDYFCHPFLAVRSEVWYLFLVIFWFCCPQLGIKSLSKQQQKPKKNQQTKSLAVDTNILLIVDFLKLPSVSRKYRWAKQTKISSKATPN